MKVDVQGEDIAGLGLSRRKISHLHALRNFFQKETNFGSGYIRKKPAAKPAGQ